MDVPPRAHRILRVITRLNVGGPSIHVMTLSRGLEAHGFEGLLVHGQLGPDEGDMAHLARTIPVRLVPSLRRPVSPVADLRALWALFRVVRQFRPHLVHTHTAKAGALGRVATLLHNAISPGPRIRIVHTYHGHVLEGYFSAARAAVFIRLERWLARHTDAIVAISPTVRKELVERFRIGRAEQYHTVPLGFDLAPFLALRPASRAPARRLLSLPDDAPVVAWVGRLVPIKEPGLFLDVARQVAHTLPAAHFVLAGDGELRHSMVRRAAELGLEHNVHWLGWQSDVTSVYAAADVVALTSRNEGTPVAIIEALAAGVPVVSTDVGGVRDIIGNEGGVLVPFGDARAAAESICRLLQHPADRKRMGAEGRRAVAARYGADRLVGDIRELYVRLLTETATAILSSVVSQK